jgi:hypothetical protein
MMRLGLQRDPVSMLPLGPIFGKQKTTPPPKEKDWTLALWGWHQPFILARRRRRRQQQQRQKARVKKRVRQPG